MEQNERYEFPASLEVEWTLGAARGSSGGKRATDRRRQLEASWAQQTGERHIVYSAYGSPYECFFVKAPKLTLLDKEGSRFQITALGRAVRRRDIPTLKEIRADEREAAGEAVEVSKEDEKRYLGGYRVIKSRFGTSKCSICGQAIDPGVKIAKGKGDSGRGGWAHATSNRRPGAAVATGAGQHRLARKQKRRAAAVVERKRVRRRHCPSAGARCLQLPARAAAAAAAAKPGRAARRLWLLTARAAAKAAP